MNNEFKKGEIKMFELELMTTKDDVNLNIENCIPTDDCRPYDCHPYND